MVELSFFEEIADKASLLLPTPYLPLLEECTAPHLLNPTLPNIDWMLSKMQNSSDDIGEILHAIRRRLHDKNGYVRQLAIKVLIHFIRKGPPLFHDALARHKGTLRELEITATSTGTEEGWADARKTAKQLILNLNSWFLDYPNPNTHSLVNMVTDVKLISGPNAFSGMTPDTSVRLPTPQSRPTSSGQGVSPSSSSVEDPKGMPAPGGGRAPQGGRGQRSEGGVRREKQRVVDAIPVFLPTESTISNMLDNCATLAEYLPNALTNPETGAYIEDDVLESFRSRIARDHSELVLLLSSDLELQRDVFRSLSENQSALLQQIKVGRSPQNRSGEEPVSTAATGTVFVATANVVPPATVSQTSDKEEIKGGFADPFHLHDQSAGSSLPSRSRANRDLPSSVPSTAETKKEKKDEISVESAVNSIPESSPIMLESLFSPASPSADAEESYKETKEKPVVEQPAVGASSSNGEENVLEREPDREACVPKDDEVRGERKGGAEQTGDENEKEEMESMREE